MKNKIGLIISGVLMLVIVPYSISAFLDTTIPFSPALWVLSGISILLFGINFYYWKYR